MRYIKSKALKTNPKEIFRVDLLAQLREWRLKGDRVALMMDANEDVIDGAMCRQLSGKYFTMSEAVYSATRTRGPSTNYKGSKAIDNIWVSEGIEIKPGGIHALRPGARGPQTSRSKHSRKLMLGVNGPQIKP